MKKTLLISLISIILIGFPSCITISREGPSEPLMPHLVTGVAGSTGRISLEKSSETEIIFDLYIPLRGYWMLHIIVDEYNTIVSEKEVYNGGIGRYKIKMKPGPEFKFERGSEYRLDIGIYLPLAHVVYGNFRVLYSYEFVI